MEDSQKIYIYYIDEAQKEICFPRAYGLYDAQRRHSHFAKYFGYEYRLTTLNSDSWERLSNKFGIKSMSLSQLKGEKDE
tara:strand:- start:817 stop:1053 length:237 start_codon:yes stop_codon:yes gene_type:complete